MRRRRNGRGGPWLTAAPTATQAAAAARFFPVVVSGGSPKWARQQSRLHRHPLWPSARRPSKSSGISFHCPALESGLGQPGAAQGPSLSGIGQVRHTTIPRTSDRERFAGPRSVRGSGYGSAPSAPPFARLSRRDFTPSRLFRRPCTDGYAGRSIHRDAAECFGSFVSFRVWSSVQPQNVAWRHFGTFGDLGRQTTTFGPRGTRGMLG